MNPDELTDEEVLTAAMLLGFEREPLESFVLSKTPPWNWAAGYGFYNHPIGRLLAIDRFTAAKAYLRHHLPKKP